MDSKRGFTLVEMVIVIFIATIISTLAVSTYSKYKHKVDLRNSARAMSADCVSLKQRAMADCVHYKIVLDAENNRYRILKGGVKGLASEYDEENAIVKNLNSEGRNIIFSADHPLNYPNAQIVFQPRGTVSAGSLVLENGDGLHVKITSNLTGRVYVSFDAH
ncbi:MAG: type II secretion system protein [Deltaproteobacteria bacterium]|nr:type II secretion system protein [Deltaproteobacteria bacterium]